ncbi:hypothetical protein [Streptomyces sp. NPDC003660]
MAVGRTSCRAGFVGIDAEADAEGLLGAGVPLEVALGEVAVAVHLVDGGDVPWGELPRFAALSFAVDERCAMRALGANIGEVAVGVDVAVVGIAERLAVFPSAAASTALAADSPTTSTASHRHGATRRE